jgi:hypothetical protein
MTLDDHQLVAVLVAHEEQQRHAAGPAHPANLCDLRT